MSQLELEEEALLLRNLIGDGTDAVAVFLLDSGEELGPFNKYTPLHGHRYCQALMKARHGESVLLSPDGLSCPAAAAAFGFRPLPAQLANGKGLVGFGIVGDARVGQRLFAGMPRFVEGTIVKLALCPLQSAPRVPDVVVVEGPVESLMWLVLADINLHGGERRVGNTAILQAACVDATVIPHLEQRLNFSFGCYGCREATDLKLGETVLGFPGPLLDPLVAKLRMLTEKAIPRSRAKLTYASLSGSVTGRISAEQSRDGLEGNNQESDIFCNTGQGSRV